MRQWNQLLGNLKKLILANNAIKDVSGSVQINVNAKYKRSLEKLEPKMRTFGRTHREFLIYPSKEGGIAL